MIDRVFFGRGKLGKETKKLIGLFYVTVLCPGIWIMGDFIMMKKSDFCFQLDYRGAVPLFQVSLWDIVTLDSDCILFLTVAFRERGGVILDTLPPSLSSDDSDC